MAWRDSELAAEDCLPLAAPKSPYSHPDWANLVDEIRQARKRGSPVILMMGAHPIKLGLSRFIIDLIRCGIVSHVATNGAGLIHDFELAVAGETSEDVPKWIKAGQFGLWEETGWINEVAKAAAASDEGLGEASGRLALQCRFARCELSIAATAWQCGVPFTAHVSIGSDIAHSHVNCDGAAWGRASYTDFLILASSIERLEGGVFLNIGSAVTGPEVYLKALSMARNVARQEGRQIRDFATAVFDLVDLPPSFREGPPGKDHPLYYYRPWKTILVRTVADGGRSYYFCGDHRRTIPSLWASLANPPA